MRPIKNKKWEAIAGNIFVLLILCIYGGLFLYSPPFAEAAEKKRWQLQPSLYFYEQYSDNTDLLPEDQISAYITELGFGLTAAMPSSRRQLKIDTSLKMDYRNRSDGTTQTLYWVGVWGYMGYQASSRLSYELSGSYDVTYAQSKLGAPFVDVFSSLSRAQLIEIRPGLSYILSKNSTFKVGGLFGKQLYKADAGVDGTEYGILTAWEQRFGSRIKLNLGGNYIVKSFDNETGYTKIEVPFTLSLDLTYLQLNLSGVYVDYTYQNSDTTGIGNFSRLVYGIGADIGGQLFRLKATTVTFSYKTNIYDDLYGQPYVNNDFRISIYHAYKKFDIYTNLKYGKDVYIAAPVSGSDSRSYTGGDVGVRWYMNEDTFMNFTADYTIYKYEPEGNTFNVFQGNIDYNRNVYEWLFAGVGYSLRNSSGNTTEANYMENMFSLYLKASW